MSVSFHLFPKLSAEVREMIWMEALAEERLIVFDFKSSLKMWLRLTPEPTLFYVNNESKSYASKYYKSFTCQTKPSIWQTTHINPDNDICYFLTPEGIHDNEEMFHKMCTFLDDNCVPYCAGVRPRRWAFDVKLLISRGASAEYRSIMLNWMGCVLSRMSWCHAVLGDEQVDEFCIIISDDEIADTIRQSNQLFSMKVSRDFTQEVGPRLEAAKDDFQTEILKVCDDVELYRGSDGCSEPPIVSFGMLDLQ
jgi:hypothetical protein